VSVPRLVSENDAAAEIGLEPSQFRHLVQTGHMPRPLELCGKYDLKACHAALDRLSGLGINAGSRPSNPLDRWKQNRTQRK
jgi:hypothetical protein